MVVYNFKTIAVVPSAKDFVDIILSKTQRKTPTVVHKGYQISRIRKFYMRKVKFTAQNYHEKVSQILNEFPRLDDIHPFYADLINVLYSRDHYKLALGQISTARTLVDNVSRDYLKLLKFGDSLYRCKELKRAALGRMCTVMKKLGPSLSYLEQVRQHLSRLPSIDPATRTMMICGYPNVGKSSFINKVSNANVEVQPYAFTTKSLFVGHYDYKYMRWQVIDTPGILDHPLEDRNTIEMQAITALAHLHSTVLYFIDISQECGYSLDQQVALFHNIKPLFQNKPLLIVANKIDKRPLSDLNPEEQALIDSMTKDRNTTLLPMSNMTEEGINAVITTGCDLLLAHRVEKKLKSKRMDDVVNRIQVARPTPRDSKVRSTSIPESVLQTRTTEAQGIALPKPRTERELELENGGPGIYVYDMRKRWELAHEEWKYDLIPEIMDGKNVADFVDPDIERKLLELEAEEEELAERAGNEMADSDNEGLDEETMATVAKIRQKKKIIINNRLLMKSNNKPHLPRKYHDQTIGAISDTLDEMGLPTDKFIQSRSASKARGIKRGRSREPSAAAADTDMNNDDMDTETRSKSQQRPSKKFAASRAKSTSRAPSVPRPISAPSPFRDAKQAASATRIAKNSQKASNQDARQGESDRRYYDKKPKHLFAGKRGIGKTDRR